jgi:hypothetical protein
MLTRQFAAFLLVFFIIKIGTVIAGNHAPEQTGDSSIVFSNGWLLAFNPQDGTFTLSDQQGNTRKKGLIGQRQEKPTESVLARMLLSDKGNFVAIVVESRNKANGDELTIIDKTGRAIFTRTIMTRCSIECRLAPVCFNERLARIMILSTHSPHCSVREGSSCSVFNMKGEEVLHVTVPAYAKTEGLRTVR